MVTVERRPGRSSTQTASVVELMRAKLLSVPMPTAIVFVFSVLLLIACNSRQEEPWIVPVPDQTQESANTVTADRTTMPAPVIMATPERLAPTPEPLVPTPLPAPPVSPAGAEAEPSQIAAVVTATPVAPLPTVANTADLEPLEPGGLRSRLGVGVPRYVSDVVFDATIAQQLGVGWYLDWYIEPDPVELDGLEYAQLYAMRDANLPLRRDLIAQALTANPGSLWLAGNEPDVVWQDNRTPEEYARLYHEFYTFIKTLDPSAQVAIAGVSQVTPLRLQYLERVLAAYEQLFGQRMPVDVWNIHTFILREERDSWGVSIPPGIDVDQGLLWEIEDHDSLDLFQQQIVEFRRWMAAQGERDKPLIVSEFGILMPESYGFPPEVVQTFMLGTFDYLLNARDTEVGLAADDHRLVQRFAWYSLTDSVYPTGNLIDLETGALTALGRAFAGYAAGIE